MIKVELRSLFQPRIMDGARRWYPLFQLMITALVLAAAAVLAFSIRFDFEIPQNWMNRLPLIILIWVAAECGVYVTAGFHRRRWRYASPQESLSLVPILGLGCLAGALLTSLIIPEQLPRSIYVLNLILCWGSAASIRVFLRRLLEFLLTWSRGTPVKRVLIYGPYETGALLLADLRHHLSYYVAGFIDDKPSTKGQTIDGVRVLGCLSDLARLVKEQKIDQVLVASNAGTDPKKHPVVRACMEAEVEWCVVPTVSSLISRPDLSRVYDISPEDLLGRPPVQLDMARIHNALSGQVVMVTGAAGSIGSELCRQIARFSPEAIIAYEINETALFFVEQEMKLSFPDIPFYSCIGSIQNTNRLAEVFSRHHPTILYHAAAYKHVPLMEKHVIEAIDNNIFGTARLLSEAAKHGVENFVMVSTDKAVRPTSLMGVTKRVAELCVRSLHNHGMKCVSVRFGNVLGSNGSVIPIFKKQIARGGPVTVTHPDMRRYFMTIPEAVQLILQASTIGEENEILVLDMGEPVRILDLAERIIRLAGHRPHIDIPIAFSGMRPGEKLYEELHMTDEEMMPTDHAKIKVFTGLGLAAEDLKQYLHRLRGYCERRTLPEILILLQEIVPDYTPSKEIIALSVEDSFVSEEVLEKRMAASAS